MGFDAQDIQRLVESGKWEYVILHESKCFVRDSLSTADQIAICMLISYNRMFMHSFLVFSGTCYGNWNSVASE